MKLCIYPGTFDPFTNGHLDVLQRAAKLFKRVRVAVAIDSTKKPLFSPEQRVALIRENLRGLPHVELEIRQDLIADAAGQYAWAQRLARLLPPLARLATAG